MFVFIILLLSIPTTSADWAFMVYLDGDNDLESSAIDDFLEMSQVGSTEDVSIVVLLDRTPGYSTDYGDWNSSKLFYVTKGMEPTPENATEEWGEVNMGDPQTLINFVNWSVSNYPAENYTLVLWNHGSGWKTQADSEKVKSICSDFTSGDNMNSQEFKTALQKINYTEKMDIIGFDACFMAMAEIDYLINSSMPSSIRVGSQDIVPGDGWPYDHILLELTSNSSMSPEKFSEIIVLEYGDYYARSISGSIFNLLTQSSVHVDCGAYQLNKFIETVKDSNDIYSVIEARDEAERFADWDYIDLYHFVELVRDYTTNSIVQSAAQDILNELDACTITEWHASEHPNAHGTSIYFPFFSSAYRNDYEELDFAINSSWDEFLRWYYQSSLQPLFWIIHLFWPKRMV